MHRAGWQWLLAVCALWVAGCTCGKPPVESELTVAFEQPVDGQRLAMGDDADPATEGFQYDVVAAATDSAGRAVTLGKATLEVQLAGEASWREGPAGVLEGARVRFPLVTMPGRTTVLRVTVEEEGSKRTATRSQSVTVGSETWSVDLTSPAEGQVLRELDDADPATPGYQVRFKLRTAGLAGREGTLVCEKACGIPPTDFVVAPGGTTEVPVTLTQAACEAQVAECYAVVKFGERLVTSPRRALTVDTVAPRVEVSGPVAPVASTTFKVEAAVGCCEDGASATLSLASGDVLTADVGTGGVSYPSVSVLEAGTQSFTLSVTDSGGNMTRLPFTVEVANTAPLLSLTAAESVNEDGDANPANGVQLPVQATVTGVSEGTPVEFWQSVNGRLGTPVRVSTRSEGGRLVADFIADLAEGENTLRACVRNVAGLESCLLKTVRVATGRKACRIMSPRDHAVRGEGNDPLSVQVEAESGPVTVRAFESGVPTPVAEESGTISGGTATVFLSLDDGEFELIVQCPGGVSQAVAVRLDTQPPVLSARVRGAPDDSGTLDGSTTDTSVLPGTQIIVEAWTEPESTVSVTGCALAAGVTAKADALGMALLREVTVPRSGTCVLTLTATDVAGNTATLKKPLVLNLDPGALEFVSPVAGSTLGRDSGEVQMGGGLAMPVKVSLPGRAGVLRLQSGTTVLREVSVTAAQTEYTFEEVILSEGINVLRGELVESGGAITCVTGLFVVNTAPVSVVLTAPQSASGSVIYNVGQDLQLDVPGIQRPLNYSVTTTATQYTVDICSDVELLTGAMPCRDGVGYTLVSNAPPNTALFTYPEGRYSLYAVLDDGALTTSELVVMTVDGQRPRVVSVQLEHDELGDRILNSNELPSGAPVVQVSTTELENGSVVQVFNQVSKSVLGSALVENGQARVVLDALESAQDVTLELAVRLVEQSGNTNNLGAGRPLDPRNDAAFFNLRLDRKPPDIGLLSPVKLSLGPADDADPATPGFQLLVAFDTSADVGPDGVAIVATPAPASSAPRTRTGTTVSQMFTVESGVTRFELSATDLLGNGNVVTFEVSMDLVPPTLAFTRPVAGSTHIGSLMTVELSVDGEEGRVVGIYAWPTAGAREKVGQASVTREADGSFLARTTVTLTPGIYQLSAELMDAAGNLATATVDNVTVDAPGCQLRFIDPAGSPVRFLARDDQNTGVPGLQYTLVGEAPDCKGLGVSLFRDDTVPAERTTSVDAAGRFSFPVTLADGETARFRVEMTDSVGNTTVDLLEASADISSPTLSVTLPRKDSAGKLFLVAASDNVNVLKTVPGYVADLWADQEGGQVQLLFDVTGAQGGQVRFFYNGSEVSPLVTPSTDTTTIDRTVTLPHDSSGTLEIRVSDASGNQVSYTAQVTVDVVSPAAPIVRRTLPPALVRSAIVEVRWDPVGDDGLSRVVQGYDLRWTTNVLVPDVIADNAQFHDTSKVRQETGKLLSSSTLAYDLKLPPLASYSIQVRACDEVGNYSPFQKETAPIANFWRRASLSNPAGSGTGNGFAKYMASGEDLNGDGKDDLVVGASDIQPGAVFVYYGSADPASAVRQELVPPDTLTQTYGGDFSLGNVGDEAGDVVADLVVGARRWTGGGSLERGRAFLYFGRKDQQLDKTRYLEFQGPSGIAANFGGSTRIIDDLDGDGLKELVFSSYGEVKTYLFFGRPVAEWRSLGKDPVTGSSCTSTTGACVIPASAADVTFVGDPGTPFFGMYRGNVTLGDLNGDGAPEMCVAAARQDINKVWLYSGSRLTKGVTLSTAATDILQLLQDPPDTGTSLNGFGTEAVGGRNLIRGPGVDFVVANPFKQAVYVYPDGGPTGFTTARLRISGGVRFGSGLRVADFNGDGLLDLLIGQNQTTNNSAWVFYNQGGTRNEFDAAVLGGLMQSRLTSSTALGISIASGDFNGDGLPDVAAGDSQSTPATVEVWY
ncbi:VCBS repeat-containing protein [Archangium violaceum]|uniref:FG-GAP-like repeat-containing protein n=1 Tax=Archangium violaceum TaxID=83451 RepID=UPI00193C59A0|nr:FG-GAP-like repeat-containing protein [Archangium violaceum]QRK13140.1 VCBS repeat-containing protein [Archangium violaceum]